MTRPPLEDNFNDILGKVRRGIRIQDSQLSKRAGIAPETLAALLAGDASDEGALRAVADVLGLGADALVALARGEWHPDQPPAFEGFAMFTTPFRDMTVNSFLLWDPETREAAAFDTGADCSPLMEYAQTHGLNIGAIFITHAHPDHVADLAKLADFTGAPVFTEEREPTAVPATSFHEGSFFRIGGLSVDALSTCGHSPGQTTFFITGLDHPVAVVGDALFAGSMGGAAPGAFAEQRDNTARKIMTLPADTVLAPGHGPLTTVAQERMHNPFFAK